MEKLKALWAKMDGAKSILGLLMIVAYYALPQFGIHAPDMLLNMGLSMAGIGLAHKLEKGTGILTKIVDILSKVLDTAKKTESKLNEKEGEQK